MVALREQIGQMLIMGFDGLHTQDSEVKSWLEDHGLGGVILFDKNLAAPEMKKNLESLHQIQTLNQELQKYSKNSLLICLDYEGGEIDRLKNIPGSIHTFSPKELSELRPNELEAEIRAMAAQLQGLGFNLNFAPVVDLNLNSTTGIIGKRGRSFSNDYQKVIDIADKFISIFKEYGIACCLKHFPGHGSANGDTHEGFVDVSQSFQDVELNPYIALLPKHEAHAMVMTAHVINTNLDNSGLPATLSRPILNDLLRSRFGFNGIIVSDDLQMHAISHHFSLTDALKLSINAGADMLIIGNQLGYNSATEVVKIIEELVARDEIESERIFEAYQRVMKFKEVIF